MRRTLSLTAAATMLALAGCNDANPHSSPQVIPTTATSTVGAPTHISVTVSANPSPSPTASASHSTRATARSSPSPTHRHTSVPTVPAGSGNSGGSGGTPVILSPSGNYYRAGEYCPEADAGLTTVDAHGNKIKCVFESGRYHWHYT